MKKATGKRLEAKAKKITKKTVEAVRVGMLVGKQLSKKYVAPQVKKATKAAKAEYKVVAKRAAKQYAKDSKVLGSEGARLWKEVGKSFKRLKKDL